MKGRRVRAEIWQHEHWRMMLLPSLSAAASGGALVEDAVKGHLPHPSPDIERGRDAAEWRRGMGRRKSVLAVVRRASVSHVDLRV